MQHPSTDNLPRIVPGKRAIISGRTGSGKSVLGSWLLSRSSQHWVVFNPKWTSAYSRLADSSVIKSIKTPAIEKSIEKSKITIVNFDGRTANAEYMDALLMYLHESFENVGFCIDELYTLHTGGRAGEGLTGVLTRGREMKQSFLGLTQRPAWVSRFCFSESDYVIGMDLALKEDRKRMVDITGNIHFSERLEARKWLFYDVGKDDIKKYSAVPLTN